MTTSPDPAPSRSKGRLYLFLGLVLPVVGVVAYIIQMSAQRLMFPWYMPTLALIGVAMIVTSLWKRRTIWRALALVLILLVSGLEIAGLYAVSLPRYTGPLAVGRAVPEFQSKKADGMLFDQNSLIGDQHSALVFFRGRW